MNKFLFHLHSQLHERAEKTHIDIACRNVSTFVLLTAITFASQLFTFLSLIPGKQDVKINCFAALSVWWKRLSHVGGEKNVIFNYCSAAVCSSNLKTFSAINHKNAVIKQIFKVQRRKIVFIYFFSVRWNSFLMTNESEKFIQKR